MTEEKPEKSKKVDWLRATGNGYDPNVARNNAMEHARRSFPEIRERRRYPLV